MEETKQLQERIEARLEQLFERRLRQLRAENADPFLVGLYEKLRVFCCCAGGKRLRPVASVMSFRACGGGSSGRGASDDVALDVAVAFELLHNSTLVHDDVMDEDALRRGKPTVWRMFADEFPAASAAKPHSGTLFANSTAAHAATHGVLAGNVLVTEALALALNAGGAPAAAMLQEAYQVVNFGQVLDVSGRITGERDYLEMSMRKTGWLFRCAIVAGARLAGAQTECQEALARFAIEAAHAFQLCDDIMDIDPSFSKGHALGSDIRQGKPTLLVLRAMQAAPMEEAAVLCRAVEAIGGPPSDADVLAAIRVIEKYSLESVRTLAAQYVERAKQSILTIPYWPDPAAARFFPAFADFVFSRKI